MKDYGPEDHPTRREVVLQTQPLSIEEMLDNATTIREAKRDGEVVEDAEDLLVWILEPMFVELLGVAQAADSYRKSSPSLAVAEARLLLALGELDDRVEEYRIRHLDGHRYKK